MLIAYHTQTNTHTHTHSLSLSHTHTLSLSQSLSLSLTCDLGAPKIPHRLRPFHRGARSCSPVCVPALFQLQPALLALLLRLHMYVSYVCIIRTYVHTYVCMHIPVCSIFMYECMYIDMYVHTYVCMHIPVRSAARFAPGLAGSAGPTGRRGCLFVCVFVYMYVCAFVCVCVCVFVCVCITVDDELAPAALVGGDWHAILLQQIPVAGTHSQ